MTRGETFTTTPAKTADTIDINMKHIPETSEGNLCRRFGAYHSQCATLLQTPTATTCMSDIFRARAPV